MTYKGFFEKVDKLLEWPKARIQGREALCFVLWIVAALTSLFASLALSFAPLGIAGAALVFGGLALVALDALADEARIIKDWREEKNEAMDQELAWRHELRTAYMKGYQAAMDEAS